MSAAMREAATARAAYQAAYKRELAAIAPLDERLRELNRPDEDDVFLTAAEEAEAEQLRAEIRRLRDFGPDEDVTPPVDAGARWPEYADELMAKLDRQVAQDLRPLRRGPRAADLAAQLEADLEAERLRTPDETAIARHRAAVAGAGRYARSLVEHEAAHAVVGELRRVRVVDARFLYGTDGRLCGAETRFETNFRDAVIDAAGAAVARVAGYTGRGSDGLSPSDVTNLARAGCRSVDQRELAIAAAAGCLRQRWVAVQRIAAALLDTGVVLGDEVRAIIRETTT